MTGTAISRSPLSHSPSTTSSTATPFTRKTMSVTQTYYLAHTARGKLAYEAGRPSHNLRLLVGHANLLDSLMVELAEAEQEQESWFNQSVRGATKEEDRRVQWADQADTIVEEPEEDWQAEDADFDSSDSEYDSEEDVDMESAGTMSLQRVSSNSITFSEEEIEIEDDGEEDLESLALHLTPSRSQQPPELDHDSDSSEDEAMPPSPPSTSLPTFSEKQRQQIATTSFYDSKPQTSIIPVSEQAAFLDEGYYLPQRQTPGLISAVSVY